jgi:hypothetical protein
VISAIIKLLKVLWDKMNKFFCLGLLGKASWEEGGGQWNSDIETWALEKKGLGKSSSIWKGHG